MVERPTKNWKTVVKWRTHPKPSRNDLKEKLYINHCHPSLPCNIAFGFFIVIARSPAAHDGRTLQGREGLAETWQNLEIQSDCMRLHVAGWCQQCRIWTTSPVSGTSDWTASWCLTGLTFCWQSPVENCLWWSIQRCWPLVSFAKTPWQTTNSWDSETPGDKKDVLMDQDIAARRSCSYSYHFWPHKTFT